jgi:hypothetical protein
MNNVYPGLESRELGQAVSQIRADLPDLDEYLSDQGKHWRTHREEKHAI